MFCVRGRIVDAENRTAEEGELFIENRRIVSPDGRRPEKTIDFPGKFIVPGFIDAHIHIESSMLTPSGFARAVLPHGTAAVVTDPHEIANVKGVPGIGFMAGDASQTPLSVYFTAPSCVPATHMETSGATLGLAEIQGLLRNESCVALGEVMNFPGVVQGVPDVMAKIKAATEAGKPVDGHAPGLSGRDLKIYIDAGISTDHECTSEQEAREKLGLGMKVMIREGSSMRNLESLSGIINEETVSSLFLVSDDIHPGTILEQGHVDRILRKAVSLGVDPYHALRMVTANPARHYSLEGLGSLRPGSRATFAVLDDLRDFAVSAFYADGKAVAEKGRLVMDFRGVGVPKGMLSSVSIPSLRAESFMVESSGPAEVNVISLPGGWDRAKLGSDGRHLLASPEDDILPIAVVERHRSTGNIGRGFVRGFGFSEGALASTVAHDSHNIIAAGDYVSMLSAVSALRRAGGGIAVTAGSRILGILSLPVAGLMSARPAEEVHENLKELQGVARDIGCRIDSPFMALAFLALPVIPELRITDMGLVDVKSFRLIDVKTGKGV